MKKKYLWDNKSIKDAIDCKLHGECFGDRIIFDSKDAKQNDIFIALKGSRVDGHKYVKDALSKGATAAIVDHIPDDVDKKEGIILVKNVFDAVVDMALFNRKRSKAKIIGITGSVGKTSTKEAVCRIFKSEQSFCTSGNYNGQIGIPIAVASMPLDTEYAVYEMGMSYSGEMTKLTKIVRPDIVIVTNIFGVHLENFYTVKDIAKAKAEIFHGMTSKGILLLNKDNEHTDFLIKCAKEKGIGQIYTFGGDSNSDGYLESYNIEDRHVKICAVILGERIKCSTKAYGQHQAMNVVISLLLAKILGLDLNTVINNLEDFTNLKGRGKVQWLIFEGNNLKLFDESYNASPASVIATLKTFKELCDIDNSIKRRIAILGDMYELGEFEKDLHRGLLEPIKLNNIDKVVTVGNLMKELFSILPESIKLSHFKDYRELIDNLRDVFEDGDAVFIKGSHGTKLYKVVEFLES